MTSVVSVEIGGDKTVFRLITPSDKKFEATAEWADGVLMIRSLTVEASNVTGQVLGEVPVAAIRDAIAAYVRKDPELLNDSGRSWPMFGSETPMALVGVATKRLLDDESLREVAFAYLNALEVAPRGPVQRLADELGEPSKRQKIASWVARARREGWLTSAVPGRAGADPGPRLIKWLEANVE